MTKSRVDQFVEVLNADRSHGLTSEQIRRVATLLAFGGAGTPAEVAKKLNWDWNDQAGAERHVARVDLDVLGEFLP